MIVTRHFVNIDDKKVHLRICGEGAPLIMLHQSPRSGAEFENLMREWSKSFTCIAPDISGFGLSDPLFHGAKLNDFADVIIGLFDKLKIEKALCYGFHSGASILFNAFCRYPERFSAGAFAGIASFTSEEKQIFTGKYLQANPPQDYGEHLVWLWSRLVEQTWFFPWYLPRNTNRLSICHNDAERIHPVVMDVISSGDEYLNGYRAVIEGDLSQFPENPPSAYLCAYNGDPLQEHLIRLGELPHNWLSQKVTHAKEMLEKCIEFLLQHTNSSDFSIPDSYLCDEGFIQIDSADFNGNIYWRGNIGSEVLLIHAPFEDMNMVELENGQIGFDLVGHGHSDNWSKIGTLNVQNYTEILDKAIRIVGFRPRKIITRGISSILGAKLNEKYNVEIENQDYRQIEQACKEEYCENLPDIVPDKNGFYLLEVWNFVRRGTFFFPWHCIEKAHAIEFEEAQAAPQSLQKRFCAAMRARCGKSLTKLILDLS